MFSFLRKVSLGSVGFSGTDFHSHILPGVDDGVQTMSESLELLAQLEQLGLKSLWLTPHIMEKFPNEPCDLRQKFQELSSCYSGPIELHLAAEYMLDSLFVKHFESNDLLPLDVNGASSLLVETSRFRPPMDFYSVLEQIRLKGYFPILAHPERFLYMTNDDYRRLKGLGAKFQLNIFSLVGGYGPQVEQRAKWLLKHGMYDIHGSDVHRNEQLMNLQAKMISTPLANALHSLNCFQ